MTWAGVSTGDTFTPLSLDQGLAAIASVHVYGTFSGGTSVSIQGTNVSGQTPITLKDVNGAAMTFTAAGLVDFSTAARFITPIISSGSADSVTVVIVIKNGV